MTRSASLSMRLVSTTWLGLAVIASLSGCDVQPYCVNNCGSAGQGDVGSVDGGSRDGSVDARPSTRDGAPVVFLDGAGCIPSGPDEFCNELDDDCDGLVDEGYNLSSDPAHCGNCATSCTLPNSDVRCNSGSCAFVECLPGFVDSDGVPGCEYRCPVFPTADEDCNGLDDDCDGMVDERNGLVAAPTDLCRRTVGTPCAGTAAVCETRGGLTTWYCAYDPSVEFDPIVPNGIRLEETLCDGVDGDCDGIVDDAFGLGAVCDNGMRGACRDAGRVVCDSADTTRTRCDLAGGVEPVPGAPSVELCNGVDDNCDGIVDNSDPSDAARVIDDMVHVTRGGSDFWIYRYEASRPDASSSVSGIAGARSCSRSGVLPWTQVSFDAAQAACAAAGHRLCTATEWLSACEGASARAYPYGAAYDTDSCNGADRATPPVVQPTGASAMCTSEAGVVDLSGNVKEWTNDVRAMSASGDTVVIRGGSFDSPQLGLTCQTDLSRATEDTLLPTLGFRCCSSTAP